MYIEFDVSAEEKGLILEDGISLRPGDFHPAGYGDKYTMEFAGWSFRNFISDASELARLHTDDHKADVWHALARRASEELNTALEEA